MPKRDKVAGAGGDIIMSFMMLLFTKYYWVINSRRMNEQCTWHYGGEERLLQGLTRET